MRLRNIEFGSVLGASGVQGIFGEGYRNHKHFRMIFPKRFSFEGMTFVAKTVTLNARDGYMPLGPDGITPLEYMPHCVHVSFRSWRKGAALNAVGLSNFGARFYFEKGLWQKRTDAFMLSFMSVEKTMKEQLDELEKFVLMFFEYLPKFNGKVGLQINFSCPNVGLHHQELLVTIDKALTIAGALGIPLVPKINLLMDPRLAAQVASHRYCDALCVSNTLPWGSLPERIDWEGIFGTKESPLKDLGSGGLSGSPILPLLIEWMDAARGRVMKPIIAGGGIMSPADVRLLSYTRPAAISLGTIAMLRPWRLADTIAEANKLIR